MPIKGNVFELKVYVDGQMIGESNDIGLCLAVLNRLREAEQDGAQIDVGQLGAEIKTSLDERTPLCSGAIAKFANMLDVDIETIRGVCDPSADEPYIHLDMHAWSDWTRNAPERGRAAVAPAAVAATLLSLWFHCAGLGVPTLRQSRAILNAIGAEGRNPTRSIRHCDWLQLRSGNTIRLNPSAIAQAVEIAKAFCERRAPRSKGK